MRPAECGLDYRLKKTPSGYRKRRGRRTKTGTLRYNPQTHKIDHTEAQVGFAGSKGLKAGDVCPYSHPCSCLQ